MIPTNRHDGMPITIVASHIISFSQCSIKAHVDSKCTVVATTKFEEHVTESFEEFQKSMVLLNHITTPKQDIDLEKIMGIAKDVSR